MSSEGMDTFREIVEELRKVEDVALKFSSKYLEQKINEAIVALLPTEERGIALAAQEQADNLFKILVTPTVDWTLMVPTVNLETEMDDILFGNVRLFNFKDDDKRRLRSRIEETYKGLQSESTNLPQKIPETLVSEFEKIVKENFAGKVCAELKISAVDSERAEEIGMQQLDMVLDGLRFYRLNRSFRDPFFTKSYFDIQGNIRSDRQTLILFASRAITFPQKAKGFLYPFKITKSALIDIRKDGFDSLSEIFRKNDQDRSTFEKDLVTSVRFCALSTRDRQIANAFVNSVISLEALLLDEHESIVDNLAERVAFIVGRNLSERNWYFDQMKRLYRIRCNVVHSGNTDIQRSDLTLLQRSINYKCIANLLNLYKSQNINSIKDLIKWIRNQKFS